jgi:hypothetical protein
MLACISQNVQVHNTNEGSIEFGVEEVDSLTYWCMI